jgi:hypothetical protein
MALRHAPIAIAALWLIGCGGGSSAKPDGGGTGGGVLGGTGGSSTGGGGAGGGTAGGPAPANPTGSLVLPGQGFWLLDMGAPCTYEEGATGDRWCAVFGAPNASGTSPLWVVNASKAASGTSVNCASGTDPNCLKLIDTFGEDMNGYHAAGFGGDTLIYYDATGGVFTPFAWRPGMTAGRQLATGDADADVWSCTADTKGTAVWCLRDLPSAMQTDPSHLLLSDLLAGHADGAATPPLARIETVIPGSSSDANGFPRFQVDFPVPGSETIAWSSRPTLTGAETLKTQTLGNDASRVTVASDINRWQVSPDGTRWYWLSHIDDTSATPTGAGTLQSAPYPAGTSPAMIAPNIVQYAFMTTGALAVLDSGEVLKSIADPVGAPTTSVSLDTGVLAFIAHSSQGHLAYVKSVKYDANSNPFTDLFVKKVDGTGACTFSTATDTNPRLVLFTPSAGGVSWVQRTIVSRAAQYGHLSDCTKTMLSPTGSTAVFARPLGDRAILYVDDVDALTMTGVATLQPLDATGSVSSSSPATVVSGQVGSLIPTASGGADILVYTVNGGGTDDGVYVRGFGP